VQLTLTIILPHDIKGGFMKTLGNILELCAMVGLIAVGILAVIAIGLSG